MKAEILLVFVAQIARACKIFCIQSIFKVACGGKQPKTPNPKRKALFLSTQKYCKFFPTELATLVIVLQIRVAWFLIYGFSLGIHW